MKKTLVSIVLLILGLFFCINIASPRNFTGNDGIEPLSVDDTLFYGDDTLFTILRNEIDSIPQNTFLRNDSIFKFNSIIDYKYDLDTAFNSQVKSGYNEEIGNPMFYENTSIDPPLAFNFSGSFNDIKSNNVDLYSGKFQEKIQLLTINDGSITIPVDLFYSTAGIAVNSIGSWVGSEWNLSYGGFVSRTVNGLPDELDGEIILSFLDSLGITRSTGVGYFNLPKYVNMPLSSNFSGNTNSEDVKDIILSADYLNKLTKGKDAYDTKLDEFNLNINGETVSFFIFNNGIVVTQPNSNYIIDPILKTTQTNSFINKIEGFTVKDGKGFTYYFGGDGNDATDVTKLIQKSTSFTYNHKSLSDIDYDRLNNGGYLPSNFNDSLYYMSEDYNFLEGKPTIKTKKTYNTEVDDERGFRSFQYTSRWHLTKIESNNGDWIKLNYEGDAISYYASRNQDYSVHNFAQLPVPEEDGDIIWCNTLLFHESTHTSKLYPGECLVFHNNYIQANTKRISSIETKNGMKVSFVENPLNRADLIGGKMLSEILYYDENNILLKKIKFSYSLALCEDTWPSYDVYYIGRNRNKQYWKRWFYYHEDGNILTLEESQQVPLTTNNTEYMQQAFSEYCRMFLQSIQIIGNESTVNCDSLNYKFYYNKKQSFPRRTSSRQDVFGFANTNKYRINVTNSIIANSANFLTNVRLENNSMDDYKEPVFPPKKEDFEEDYGLLWYGGSNITGIWYNIRQQANENRYYGAIKSPNFEKASAGVLDSIVYPYGGSKKIHYELNQNGASKIGGLRVKETILYTDSTEAYKLKYVYGVGYLSEPNNTFSLRYDLSTTHRNTGRSFTSEPVSGRYYTKSGVCGYESVKIVEPSGAYTQYWFSSPKDVKNQDVLVFDYENTLYNEPSYRFPNPRKSEIDYKRGLITEIDQYDRNQRLIRANKFYYHFEKSAEYLEEITTKYQEIIIGGFAGIHTTPVYSYAITKKFFEDVKKSKIVTYDYVYSDSLSNPDTIKITKEFYYKYPTFNDKKFSYLDSIVTISPDNSQIKEVYHSVGNYLGGMYHNGSILQNLIKKNCFDAQIGYEKILKKGNSQFRIDGQVSDYKVFSDSIIKPKNRFYSPGYESYSSLTEFINKSTGQIVIPESFLEDIEFVSYDKSGRLTEFKAPSSYPTSMLYSKNSSIVAEVTNASLNEIAFNNFEDSKKISGSGYYGTEWESGFCSISDTDSYTGKNCFVFQGSSLKTKKALPAGKYRVRMWTKTSNGSIGSITLSNIAGISWAVSSNWQMQEKIITLTSNTILNFSASGGAIMVDDISIVPYDAQIESYTWHLLYGMTSRTDNNGNTLFYSYDSMGRLIFVKDQDGNIIESHKYNIAK